MSTKDNCIICGVNNTAFWAEQEKYKAVKCLNCGLIWIDPLPTEEELNEFYDGYYQSRVENIKMWEQRQVMYLLERDWLEQFIKEGRLLDIGCSDGSFLSVFGPLWEKYGVEIGKDEVNEANKKGLNVVLGSEEAVLSFGKKFDVVILRGTIEHFRNPKNVIKASSSVLKPGSYLFVTSTPDVDSFCADLYRDKWNQFEPPAHLYYFSIKTLTELVKQFGFQEVAQHHFYPETPYANLEEDHKKVLDDMQLIKNRHRNQVNKSAAFWGNMMTVLYKKE